MRWLDYDGDGDYDVAAHNGLFRREGDTYTKVRLADREFRTVWRDYDRDGDPDLLLTGEWFGFGEGHQTRLYVNSDGALTDTGLRLPEILSGDAFTWVDADNDGDDDIFLAGAGYSYADFISKLYLNAGDQFVETTVDFPGVQAASADWGDLDNDGDLDLLLTGASTIGGGYITKLYRNDTPAFQATETPTPQQVSVTPTPTFVPTAISVSETQAIFLPIVAR